MIQDRYAGVYRTRTAWFAVSSFQTTAGVWIEIGPCRSIPATHGLLEKAEFVLQALAESKGGIDHPTDWKAVPESPILAATGVRSWSALSRISNIISVFKSNDNFDIEAWRVVGRGGWSEKIPGADIHLPPDATPEQLGRALERAFESCDPLQGNRVESTRKKPNKGKRAKSRTGK